jgi:hypothetical protein
MILRVKNSLSRISRELKEICTQLVVFEAFEHGLLASWETPDALVCVQRSA